MITTQNFGQDNQLIPNCCIILLVAEANFFCDSWRGLKMVKFILLLFIGFGLIFVLNTNIYACVQSGKVNLRERAVEADAVFIAKSLKVESVQVADVGWTENKKYKTFPLKKYAQKVFFEISEVTKGSADNLSESIFYPSSCTFNFSDLVGVDVIVFAFKRSPLLSEDKASLPEKDWIKEMIFRAEADRLNKDLPPFEIIAFPLNYVDEKELKVVKSINFMRSK